MDQPVNLKHEFKIGLDSLMPEYYESRLESVAESATFCEITSKWTEIGGIFVPGIVNSRSRKHLNINGREFGAPMLSTWRFHWFEVNQQREPKATAAGEQNVSPNASKLVLNEILDNPGKIDRDFVFKVTDPVLNGAKTLTTARKSSLEKK